MQNNIIETDLGNISPNPRGKYDESAAYEYLDFVKYMGSSYLCTVELGQTITGTAPVEGETTEYWQLICDVDYEKISNMVLQRVDTDITQQKNTALNAINNTALSQMDEINNTATAQIKAATNNINVLAGAKIADIESMASGKISDINSLAVSKSADINTIGDAQISNINNTASQQISNINNTVTQQVNNINRVANSQIDAINNTAQAQAAALDKQGEEILDMIKCSESYVIEVVHGVSSECIDVADYDSICIDELDCEGDKVYLHILAQKGEETRQIATVTEPDTVVDVSHWEKIYFATTGNTVVHYTLTGHDMSNFKAQQDANTNAIETLNGTGEGSVSKQVADGVAQIVADASEMNSKISTNTDAINKLKALIGELPEDASATDVISYIADMADSIDFSNYALKENVYTKEETDKKTDNSWKLILDKDLPAQSGDGTLIDFSDLVLNGEYKELRFVTFLWNSGNSGNARLFVNDMEEPAIEIMNVIKEGATYSFDFILSNNDIFRDRYLVMELKKSLIGVNANNSTEIHYVNSSTNAEIQNVQSIRNLKLKLDAGWKNSSERYVRVFGR